MGDFIWKERVFFLLLDLHFQKFPSTHSIFDNLSSPLISISINIKIASSSCFHDRYFRKNRFILIFIPLKKEKVTLLKKHGFTFHILKRASITLSLSPFAIAMLWTWVNFKRVLHITTPSAFHPFYHYHYDHHPPTSVQFHPSIKLFLSNILKWNYKFALFFLNRIRLNGPEKNDAEYLYVQMYRYGYSIRMNFKNKSISCVMLYYKILSEIGLKWVLLFLLFSSSCF